MGGVSRDAPEGWAEKVLQSLDRVKSCATTIDALLTRNRIFMDRTRGTGVISRADALDFGFTGPCLRATGEPYDLRKAAPYCVYDRLDFDIPVGTHGDNFDRYLMRMEEMRQSDRIVRQCFAQMEPGARSWSTTCAIVLPPKPLVYGTIEGVMAHFKLVMEGIQVPARRGLRLHRGGERRAGLLRRLRRRRPAVEARHPRARAGPCWRPSPT